MGNDISILGRKPKDLQHEFLTDWCNMFGVSYSESELMIKQNFDFYNDRTKYSITNHIENDWYDSLKNGTPDYSVYDDEHYYIDLWCCWKVYARRYLKCLLDPKSLQHNADHTTLANLMGGCSTVVDLGCGIAYSTVALQEIFPHMKVYGFNIEDSQQYKFCKLVGDKYNIQIINNLDDVGPIDIIFASEYFEHFERPIEHLEYVIKTLNPKYIIAANSFNTKSIGHFIDYKHHDTTINQVNIHKKWILKIKQLGYNKVNTKIFNNKPAIYKLNSVASDIWW